MKRNILAGLSAMMLIGGIGCGTGTQNKESSMPGAVSVDVVKLTGIVKAIDREKKMVTVEGSGGRTVVIDATNARNLDQLKVAKRGTGPEGSKAGRCNHQDNRSDRQRRIHRHE
jgi:hypothetical protein